MTKEEFANNLGRACKGAIESYLEHLLETSGDNFWILNPESVLIYIKEEGIEIVGFHGEDEEVHHTFSIEDIAFWVADEGHFETDMKAIKRARVFIQNLTKVINLKEESVLKDK